MDFSSAILERKKAANRLVVDEVINNDNSVVALHPETMEKFQLFRGETILIKVEVHFEANQKDLDLLKHDKVLSKKLLAPHLRVVLDYLLDATTKEASKRVKLARAAMGNNNLGRRGLKKKFKKDEDPLKSLSAQGPKKGRKERKDGSDNHK